jgi:hypothetical protein
VPKTAAGEDLGVGEGWWYDGMLIIYLSPVHSILPKS